MKETKKCKTCGKGERVYVKGMYGFKYMRKAYCTVCDSIERDDYCCKAWCQRDYDLSPERLRQVEDDVRSLIEELPDKM